MLSRLRRYQQLLIMGGGALITLFVLFTCALQIWASVSSCIAGAKDEMAAAADRAENAVGQLAAGMRNDVRSIGGIWAVMAIEGHYGQASLMEAVASARRTTDLTVYVLDADLRPLVVSTAPGLVSGWDDVAMADRAGAQRTLLDMVGTPAASRMNIPLLMDESALQWRETYVSPISGKRVVGAVAAVMGFNGRALGTLVFELPLSRLAALMVWDDARGGYLVLDEASDVLVSTPELASTDVISVVRQGLDRGLGPDLTSRYQNGYLMTGWSLAPTPWRLVYVLPQQAIVAGVTTLALVSILTAILISAVAWILLSAINRKIFQPVLMQSQLVFESEQLSRVLVDTAPVGLGLIAIDTGQPLLRSPAMEEVETIAVVPGGNLSAELCFQFLHYETSGQDEPRALNLELSLVTRSGAPMDLSVSLARARYMGEDALVVAFVDATTQKQTQRALHEARQAADSANAAKSAFLAAMSHEIRTPLNAIQGNLELMTHSPLDPMQRDRLGMIRSASEDLLATVNDILDFSKIEAGELHLEQTVFDVHHVAARTLIMFAPLARTKGLTLAGDFGERPKLMMRGDATRLTQVFNNLLSNALKFTSAGRVTMSLATEDEGRQLLVTVADTGIGMSPEQLAGTFRAFNQADTTINRRFGGTGLGLALCARLACAMGGSITATSDLGRGSCFMVRLPLGAAPMGEPLPRFSGERVVLVADDTGASVARALSAWGLCVERHDSVGQVRPEQVDDAPVVVLWGERRGIGVGAENRLVESASCVIDCSSEGPSRPVVMGRLINVSIYGLQGLLQALESALWCSAPQVQEPQHSVLARRLSVLVVEDHPVTRRLLSDQLTLLGCDVQTASDGEQALRSMAVSPCEVLVTDLAMPGMDGYALVRRVHESWPSLPILVVTADVTPLLVNSFADEGHISVLGKPLTLDALRQALSQVSTVDLVPKRVAPGDGLLGGLPLPDELAESFQSANAASLQALEQAWENGDVARLLTELHALRGALGVFGMGQLARQSAELSTALERNEMTSCRTRFMRFCADLKRSFYAYSDTPQAEHGLT